MGKGIKWAVVEEHYDAHPFPFYMHMDLVSTGYPAILGDGFKNTILLCEGSLMLQVFDESEFSRIGLHALKKITGEMGFASKIRGNARKGLEALMKVVDRMLEAKMADMSNIQLAETMEEYVLAFSKSSVWGTIISFIEYENFYGSKKIGEYIRRRLGNMGGDENEVFALLSAWPEKTFVLREREELLKIAEMAGKKKGADLSKMPLAMKKALSMHSRKYGWLAYSYQGPLLEEEYFEMELAELVASGMTYEGMRQDELRRSTKRSELMRRLNFSENEREAINTLAELFFLKALRRDVDFKSNYALSFVFRELSKRTGVSVNQARFMLAQEIIGAFRTRIVDAGELQRRTRGFAYCFREGKLSVLSGNDALELKKLLPTKRILVLNEFAGEVASMGIAKGRVKIVRGKSDYAKFMKGDVLVAVSTNQNMVPLMKKAAAIVTETGGITSHAAIVSRELGVPCIIGTRIATSALKDGDLIEVDARKGKVRKL
ncbi:MAG: PEP-utilizing enzyme [Candidatus Micrarchaeota archaeon]